MIKLLIPKIATSVAAPITSSLLFGGGSGLGGSDWAGSGGGWSAPGNEGGSSALFVVSLSGGNSSRSGMTITDLQAGHCAFLLMAESGARFFFPQFLQ
jgi:hypothetical protein